MKFIHYTAEKFDIELRSYSLEGHWRAKPNGLWFSVEMEERFPNNYNWKEWCESEDYNLDGLKHSYELFFREDANILHLKTAEEVFEFGKKHYLKTRDWDADSDTYQLDWAEVKKKYQGIIISPYQWSCRLALESCWYYGWDCSSGCIWDLSCIREFKLIEVNHEPVDHKPV